MQVNKHAPKEFPAVSRGDLEFENNDRLHDYDSKSGFLFTPVTDTEHEDVIEVRANPLMKKDYLDFNSRLFKAHDKLFRDIHDTPEHHSSIFQIHKLTIMSARSILIMRKNSSETFHFAKQTLFKMSLEILKKLQTMFAKHSQFEEIISDYIKEVHNFIEIL